MVDDPRAPFRSGGMPALLELHEERRAPLIFAAGEALPPLDCDLDALATLRVGDPDADPAEAPPFRSSYHRKRHAIRRELCGQDELVALNALLIAILRKRSFPADAPALFLRLWTEAGGHLTDAVDPRWLVSSLATFGDHGETVAQRSLGLALATLMGTMKLFEFERLHSGHAPDQPFPLDRKVAASLPMAMQSYALLRGGLDVTLVARLWREAEGDAVIGPPARRLLEMLLSDPGTLFRRLEAMRDRRARRQSAPAAARGHRRSAPRWGLVSTVKASAPDVLRFAAHHLELGADALHIFLDAPDAETEARLAGHPQVTLTVCDAAYWQREGKARPEAHQVRQAWNATRTLRRAGADLDWLGHVDVDEMLLADTPVGDALAALPAATLFARVPPAELLAPSPGGQPRHFKLCHRGAGQPRSAIETIYPTFGMHLADGFLSHTSGKAFARTGLGRDIRFGVHGLRQDGAILRSKAHLAGLHLGHLHAPSWTVFRDRLAFRCTQGSYRARDGEPDRMSLADMLRYLETEEGEAGLQSFFEEVCRDTPELRARLDAHGMLLEHALDLDAGVGRVFGIVPA